MLLLSSFLPEPEVQFQGYCWVGPDLVVGQEGADKYRELNGDYPGPGNDGCYIVVSRELTGWRVGTDSRGLARIFVYENDDVWALSSSFYELVTHLRSNGVSVKHIPALLAAYGVPRGFNDQVASSSMPIENISLAPSFSTVIISTGGVEIVPTPMPSLPTYEESLYTYIASWKSRLSTLIADERVSIQVDLSGGIDSRAVLAFFLADGSFSASEDRLSVVSARSKEALRGSW